MSDKKKPKVDLEWDAGAELDKIFTENADTIIDLQNEEYDCECVQCEWKGTVDECNDWDGQLCCPECGEPVELKE